MRRQRVLERVGWRFWRCFASSFYRDPDSVSNDLFETLGRVGIEPIGTSEKKSTRQYTERRVIEPPQQATVLHTVVGDAKIGSSHPIEAAAAARGITVGDRLILVFAEDQRRISVRLTQAVNDPDKGLLSVASPLGQAVHGAEEGDEVQFELESGFVRKAMIELVENAERHLEPAPAIGDSYVSVSVATQ